MDGTHNKSNLEAQGEAELARDLARTGIIFRHKGESLRELYHRIASEYHLRFATAESILAHRF